MHNKEDLKQLIYNVNNWNNMSPEDILLKLQEKNIQYVNKEIFTLLGLAKIIGREKMKPLQDFLASINCEWVFQQAVGGLPIGDPELNREIASIPHPDCQLIANTGRRMISVLEKDEIEITVDDITVLKSEMILALKKQEIISKNSEKWNDFCSKVDLWDGSDPEPEL